MSSVSCRYGRRYRPTGGIFAMRNVSRAAISSPHVILTSHSRHIPRLAAHPVFDRSTQPHRFAKSILVRFWHRGKGMMRAAIVITGLCLVSGPAVAQDQGGPAQAVVDAIDACRSIGDDDERLACFDRAANQLNTAIASKEIIILDRAETRKARRSLFGFTLPRLRLFGNETDEESEAIREINATIASAAPTGQGLWRITLSEGGVWQTTEADSAIIARAGQPVRIRAGALGSYFARFSNGRSVRARRVQ